MAGAATAALVLALRLYRPWHLRWGSTDEEVQRALPGDEVVPDPTFAATRAITVHAPPERVWPWIAQMGFGRAGWYSYDLLDNFGRRSSERVIASLQEVQVGDTVPMGPGGGGLRVKGLEPGQWLLWWDGVGHSTWAWRLESAGPGRTRLLTRVRIHYRWTHPTILFNLLLVEPWDFPMMRKCMIGIVVSMLTGARTVELRALRWQHVHADPGGTIPPHIEAWRSVRFDGDTKTKKSRRTLALPVRCIEALRKQRAQQVPDRLAAGEQ